MVHWKFRGGRLGEGPKGQNLQGRLEFSEGVPGDSNQQHFATENGYFLEPHIIIIIIIIYIYIAQTSI